MIKLEINGGNIKELVVSGGIDEVASEWAFAIANLRESFGNDSYEQDLFDNTMLFAIKMALGMDEECDRELDKLASNTMDNLVKVVLENEDKLFECYQHIPDSRKDEFIKLVAEKRLENENKHK